MSCDEHSGQPGLEGRGQWWLWCYPRFPQYSYQEATALESVKMRTRS